jgi:tRNA dimethylallyltransferase
MNDRPMPRYAARFLVGPTATGKTSVAQWIAERHGFDILSADSMLVYRGMDIGTAKPGEAERGGVRYWGVDVVLPGEPFNVARYRDEARRCFESAGERGAPVLVVGGTGLYIKVLTAGLAAAPGPADAARERWRAVLRERGVAGLQEALRSRSPEWFEALPDRTNSRRLLRALERVDAGQVYPPRNWDEVVVQPELTGLRMPREPLHARIVARVEEMYAKGLLDETRRLLDAGLAGAPTAMQAVGYAEAAACLEGRITREAAIERTIQRTRQLAKRQMTWFRHQAEVRWVDIAPDTSIETAAAHLLGIWAATDPVPVVL